MSAPYAQARPRIFAAAMLAAMALGFSFASPAHACDLAIEAPEAVRIEYNPFAIGASSGPLDIVFRNRSETACEMRLVLIDDLDNPLRAVLLAGVVVEFRPREASGVFRRDVEPGVFLLSVAGNSETRAELDAAVVENAVVEAGEHQVDLRLSVQPLDSETPLPPIPLRVLLLSTPRAQVNIAGAAGAFGAESSVEVVDFGEAVTGAVRRVFVQVRANTQSTLSMKSEHGGVLRHVEMGEKGTQIAYQVALDGVPVSLSEPWTGPVDPPRTLDGVSLPLDFILGEVTGQMSGRYEDLLTIDITPK